MPSEVKVTAVEQLTQVLEGAKSVYLTDFTGMPVEMMASLRRRCRESEVEYRVVKDSLTKLAAKRAGMEAVVDYLEGPTGLALGRGDELAPARVLTEFAREHKLPKIKAALVEGRMFTEDGVKTLAVLPSREILLGQFVSGMMAPLSGLRGVIDQVMWKLVATLQAAAESMEKGGEAQAEEADEAEAAAAEVSPGKRGAVKAEAFGPEAAGGDDADAAAGAEGSPAKGDESPAGMAAGGESSETEGAEAQSGQDDAPEDRDKEGGSADGEGDGGKAVTEGET
jgi:large subunit ribosomal protein L10